MSFETVTKFETQVAKYFGCKYAIAVDSCTHGIELCLRYTKATSITVPKHTYLSIPNLANKLNIDLVWKDENWVDYYRVTSNIIDAAVLWKENSYLPGTFMNLSFQYQKHLSLGRGGIILTDNEHDAIQLKKMSYDGRLPNIPWREQNIDSIGYHYYMTPETAQLGLAKFNDAVKAKPKQWAITDWPDLTKMPIFQSTIDLETYCENNNIDPYLETR
jgi:dTDP-4-amino-4,6-dideoxygalactose transaminase